MYFRPHLVGRVTTASGEVLYDQSTLQGEQRIDPRVARNVTEAMRDVPEYDGVSLEGGRQAAGKTGTVESRVESQNNDAWFAGYTPNASTVVWVGTDDNTPIRTSDGRPVYGHGLPSEIWKTFMDDALEDAPKQTFGTFTPVAGSDPGDTARDESPSPSTSASAASSSAPTSTTTAPAVPAEPAKEVPPGGEAEVPADDPAAAGEGGAAPVEGDPPANSRASTKSASSKPGLTTQVTSTSSSMPSVPRGTGALPEGWSRAPGPGAPARPSRRSPRGRSGARRRGVAVAAEHQGQRRGPRCQHHSSSERTRCQARLLARREHVDDGGGRSLAARGIPPGSRVWSLVQVRRRSQTALGVRGEVERAGQGRRCVHAVMSSAATTFVGCRRTTSSPGTPLRRPNSSARSSPM